MYGKDGNFQRWFNRHVDAGNVRFINKEKAANFFGSHGLQLPSGKKLTASNNNIITEEHLVKAFDKFPHLYQKKDVKRGFIRFGGDETLIGLTEHENLSTFLHESGHLFLEVMRKQALQANAPKEVKDQMKDVMKWLGVKNASEIHTEQHEQFARGFEAYLREGSAPSVELQSAFARFRAWLVNIYKSIKGLNVELNDDIRAVMDRMLATDEQIKVAEEQAKFVTSSEIEGLMTKQEQEQELYHKAAEKARMKAEEDLLSKTLKEITRERKSWWKQEYLNVRAKVEYEEASKPVYRALNFFKTGEIEAGLSPFEDHKLSKADLIAEAGKDVLKHLPRHGGYIYSKEGGLKVEFVADMFGFSSADKMIKDLLDAQPLKKVVDMRSDKIMKERHGDILNDGSLEKEALAVVHSDERAKFLATELKVITKKSGSEERTPAAIALATAKRIIADKKVSKIHEGQYVRAQVKAAKE